MTVLDTSGVVAWLQLEPATPEVDELLPGARMTAIGVAETVDKLARRCGVDPDEVASVVAGIGMAPPIAVTATLGADAGSLRARQYHRVRRRVSMADCVAAEAARLLGRPLATSDPHLLAMCHEEGIEVVVLPDSDGRRWSPEQGV